MDGRHRRTRNRRYGWRARLLLHRGDLPELWLGRPSSHRVIWILLCLLVLQVGVLTKYGEASCVLVRAPDDALFLLAQNPMTYCDQSCGTPSAHIF